MAKRVKAPKDTRAQIRLKFADAADVEELRQFAEKWMEGNLALYLRTCARLVDEAGGPWARFDKRAVAVRTKEKRR
jgi:hypothetical protein